jgi:hypothetical protein
MPRTAIVLISLLLIFFLPPNLQNSFSQQTAGQLYEQGLYLEEGKGDLQGALEKYQTILKQFLGDRGISAKAQLHIGLCFEKLGKTEARKAYERVITQFPDQQQVVKEARERLAFLAGPRPTMLTTRRLENPPADTPTGAVSPDGRYFSFWDWRTGDLAVRDLASGADRRLTSEGTEGEENPAVEQYCMGSTWSPDNKQIAYTWYITSDQENCVEARVVGLIGGKPRVLARFERDKGGELEMLDWSPDGTLIVASLSARNEPQQILLISTTDGSMRLLRLTAAQSLTTVCSMRHLRRETFSSSHLRLGKLPLWSNILPMTTCSAGRGTANGSSLPVTGQAPWACGWSAYQARKPMERRGSSSPASIEFCPSGSLAKGTSTMV